VFTGVLKRAEKWRQGKWVEGVCFDEQGKEVPYCSYWQQPEFVGGLPALYRYLAEELRYPPKARKKNIEGTVYVRFIVEKNGGISEIELLRSVQKDLDEEALRVVGSMPDWQPGKKEGTPVRVQFTLPLKFRLE
jgi:periplasmic protein TonB